MKSNNKKIVFVGVSGGVDSSVALALLKKAGYNVVGVFIRTWTPDFLEFTRPDERMGGCTWRDERRDAMRVCARLDVPFLECDAIDAYKKGVADYMIKEYKKGRTPNPDVMCNREVKFGVFWDFAKARGADYIATGHYTQISIRQEYKENGKIFSLLQSKDMSKDQSYFLWTLTQEDLSHTIFPIGHLEKTEVRKQALKFDLPTAVKKDSQGVCFLGPLDMKDFLKHYIKSEKGIVENVQGEKIGTHDGVLFYTLGERHGFNIEEKGIIDRPYYVVAKDIQKNILTVSQNKDEFKNKNEFVELENVITRGDLQIEQSARIAKQGGYRAQVRYHGEFLPIKIIEQKDDKLKIQFLKQDSSLASGQSVVIYDGDICLAGGVVL